jgi:hypothetical protein
MSSPFCGLDISGFSEGCGERVGEDDGEGCAVFVEQGGGRAITDVYLLIFEEMIFSAVASRTPTTRIAFPLGVLVLFVVGILFVVPFVSAV